MRLPKTVFVKIMDGGTGPDYLSADAMPLLEVGEEKLIGRYELTEAVTYRGEVIRLKKRTRRVRRQGVRRTKRK
jgi:hypothetical protein